MMNHNVSRSPAGRHRSGTRRPTGGGTRRSHARRRIGLSSIALAVVFLVGLGLLLYPTVSNWWNSRASRRPSWSTPSRPPPWTRPMWPNCLRLPANTMRAWPPTRAGSPPPRGHHRVRESARRLRHRHHGYLEIPSWMSRRPSTTAPTHRCCSRAPAIWRAVRCRWAAKARTPCCPDIADCRVRSCSPTSTTWNRATFS